MQSVMDRLDQALTGLGAKGVADIDALLAPELSRPWLPEPGPQLEAFLSEADLLLYGGAAGGGKTDLLCGLVLTEHRRSVIFRKQANDLDGFWERLLELCPSPRHKDSNKKKLTTQDGRMVECGHLELPGSELSWQGRPHDLIGFDEGAQLSAHKVKFVLGWLRSADGRRCRAVIASNPPIGAEGSWMMEWFAPWLDPLHANPAVPGELRWAVAVGDQNEIRTIWVDGPEPVIVGQDGNWRAATPEEAADTSREDLHEPLSRTFIPSKLDDNPYLRDTKYRAQIMSMTEPLRSQLLYGDFLAGRQDDEWQVVPTAWIKAAQERWSPPTGDMRSIGVDPAQGGPDKTALACLYQGEVFGQVETRPGSETPDGPSVAALIMKLRRNNAAIAIDMTGGWGGSARDHLLTHNEIMATPIVFSGEGPGSDPDTKFGYANLRAKMYWEFRRALDPDNGDEVALPPGERLLAQLSASRWKPRSGKILIESKEDIRARLKVSPDEADAIVMAWFIRDQSVKAVVNARPKLRGPSRSGSGSLGWMGR